MEKIGRKKGRKFHICWKTQWRRGIKKGRREEMVGET
jgi:hypothetical protein